MTILTKITPAAAKKNKQDHCEILAFPYGVPGFPTLNIFQIHDLDDGSHPPLKMMVSVDNPEISFLLYPHVKERAIYDEEMIASMAAKEKTSRDDLDIYSIVTIRQPEGEVALTINLQAPIVVDRHRQKGWQHIHTNSKLDNSYLLSRFEMF